MTTVDLDALVDAMFLPAARLVLAVRSRNEHQAHILLAPLDRVELQALAIAMAELFPVDDVAPQLLAMIADSASPSLREEN